MEKILDKAATVEFSPDGAWLYYSTGGQGPSVSLFRRPIAGGEPQQVIAEVGRGQKFAVTQSGIWYLTPNTAEGCLLQFYDFVSKSTRTVYRATRASYSGFAVSPDQRRILFSQIERRESHDLIMVESYR